MPLPSSYRRQQQPGIALTRATELIVPRRGAVPPSRGAQLSRYGALDQRTSPATASRADPGANNSRCWRQPAPTADPRPLGPGAQQLTGQKQHREAPPRWPSGRPPGLLNRQRSAAPARQGKLFDRRRRCALVNHQTHHPGHSKVAAPNHYPPAPACSPCDGGDGVWWRRTSSRGPCRTCRHVRGHLIKGQHRSPEPTFRRTHIVEHNTAAPSVGPQSAQRPRRSTTWLRSGPNSRPLRDNVHRWAAKRRGAVSGGII